MTILERLGELAAEVDAEATGRGATHWRLGRGEAVPLGAWVVTHRGGSGVQVRACPGDRTCDTCHRDIPAGEVMVTMIVPPVGLMDFCLGHSPASVTLEGGD